MSIASLNLRSLTLTSRASDIQFRIMLLSNRRMALTYKTGDIQQKYYNAMQQYIKNNPDQDIVLDTQTFAVEYEQLMAAVNTEDLRMELEMKQLETQNKAVTTEQESVKKQLDNNIKKEFNALGR